MSGTPMPPLDLTMNNTAQGRAESAGSTTNAFFGSFGAVKSGISSWVLVVFAFGGLIVWKGFK